MEFCESDLDSMKYEILRIVGCKEDNRYAALLNT